MYCNYQNKWFDFVLSIIYNCIWSYQKNNKERLFMLNKITAAALSTVLCVTNALPCMSQSQILCKRQIVQ